MKKLIFPLVALVMALVLGLGMATPAAAQEPCPCPEWPPGVCPEGAYTNAISLYLQYPAQTYHVGDTIEYTVIAYVPNWGEPPGTQAAAVTNLSVSFIDPHGDICILAGPNPGDPPLIPVLCPGGSSTFTSANNSCLAYVIAEGDIIPAPNRVSANASGTGTSWPTEVGENAAAEVEISTLVDIANPNLSIEKTVDFNGDGVYTDYETNSAGETASWQIEVCNTGDSTVYNIVVTDTNGHDFGSLFDLGIGECRTFFYDMVMNVDTVNTACAEGMDAAGAPVGPVCDPAQVHIPSHHVPTLSQWGMIGMAILFAALLIWSVRRRRLVSASRR